MIILYIYLKNSDLEDLLPILLRENSTIIRDINKIFVFLSNNLYFTKLSLILIIGEKNPFTCNYYIVLKEL
jgi:hypothetical protein